ncbi:hypothetical protein MJ1HA_1113 [Metallosphaera sedula]|nr:hypothetical protein MJ1HA_1113 [Metallosphaera sedula]
MNMKEYAYLARSRMNPSLIRRTMWNQNVRLKIRTYLPPSAGIRLTDV